MYLLHFAGIILLVSILIRPADAVHGHHFLRKSAQQKQTEDAELEEELDADAEEEDLVDRIISMSTSSRNTEEDRPADREDQFAKVFEQGETRDFLAFLRRIRYDHRQCPQNAGQPVLISVSVVVSNVRAVSEVTMDYSLEMFYRESWRDERLRYDARAFRNKTELSLHESYANFLWHPDTFMPNAIASKNPRKQSISHRSLLRLQSDGQILYSRRLSVVAECPMDLTLFPFDSQTCKLGIESYGYTSDQVTYGWSRGQREALKLHKIRLPDFRIKEAFVTSQLEAYATGNYSRLYVCFVFSRSAGFCFLQLIIPSTAVVITSWVSLWMENETSFQDMISIILTITFLLFSYNEVMPRVSYLKALDIWLAVCFMIVFLSLIKLAIMKYMRQRLRVDMATGTRAVPASLLGGMLPLIQLGTGGTIPYGYGSGGGGAGLLFPQRASLMASHRSIDGTLRRPPTPPQQMRSSFQQLPNSVATHTHRPSKTLRSTGGSSAEEEQKRRQSQRSTISQGLQMTLGGACIPQMVAQNVVRRKRSSESPVQPSISTLAASQMHLPLNESSLRQLQQQTLYQAHQQLQLQVQLEQARLLHQAQLQALQEQRARERRARRERAERKKAKQEQEQLQQMRQRKAATKRPTTLQAVDANDNLVQMPKASSAKIKGRGVTASRPHHHHHHRSPVNAIRVGIETTSSSSTSDPDNNHSSTDSETGDARRTAAAGEERLFFGLFDQFGNVEFSASFMRRFHWVTQMSFFFFFVLFCLYFFLVYPNSRSTSTDPACKREEAEWFASIPV